MSPDPAVPLPAALRGIAGVVGECGSIREFLVRDDVCRARDGAGGMQLAVSQAMSTLRTLCLAASLTVLLAGMQSAAPSGTASAALAFPASSTVSDAVRSPLRGPTGTAVGVDANSAETRYANGILDGLKARYRYLDGVSVRMGTTPNSAQAVAYYTQGRIVVNSTHSVEMATILAHEIWHIIDWRDNGRLDWGESLPPHNSEAYQSE